MELRPSLFGDTNVKTQYLKTQNAQSTADFINFFPNKKYGHEHNILEWAKELNMPANIVSSFKDNNRFPLVQLHAKKHPLTIGF